MKQDLLLFRVAIVITLVLITFTLMYTVSGGVLRFTLDFPPTLGTGIWATLTPLLKGATSISAMVFLFAV
jgi:hypothetical protein